MKKIKLIIIFFFLCLPIPVFATSGNIIIECPQTAYAGTTINCNISINNSGNFYALQADYSLNGLEYKKFTYTGSFDQPFSSASTFGFGNYNDRAFSAYQPIGTIQLGIPTWATGEYTFGLTNIIGSVVNEDDYYIPNAYSKISIVQKSSNNNLAVITVNGENVPLSENMTYKTENKSITINAIAEDTKSVVSGNGTYYIGVGTTKTYIINVTAEDGNIKTYRLNIIQTSTK